MDQQLGQKNAIQFIWNRANFNTSPDFLNGNQPPSSAHPGPVPDLLARGFRMGLDHNHQPDHDQ